MGSRVRQIMAKFQKYKVESFSFFFRYLSNINVVTAKTENNTVIMSTIISMRILKKILYIPLRQQSQIAEGINRMIHTGYGLVTKNIGTTCKDMPQIRNPAQPAVAQITRAVSNFKRICGIKFVASRDPIITVIKKENTAVLITSWVTLLPGILKAP